MGEGHGRREDLGSTVEEPFGVMEAACIESMVRNWRDPILHNKSCKSESYKPEGEIDDGRKGVRGVHSTEENTYNITVAREGTLLHSSYSKEVRASECP